MGVRVGRDLRQMGDAEHLPVAAHLASGAPFESSGPVIDPASIERLMKVAA